MVIKGIQIQDFLVEFVRTIMIVGLFTWLVERSDEILKTIFDGLAQLGSSAAQLGDIPSPSRLLTMGTDAAGSILDTMNFWDALDGDALLKLAVAGAVMVLFIFVALNVLLAFISFYFNFTNACAI